MICLAFNLSSFDSYMVRLNYVPNQTRALYLGGRGKRRKKGSQAGERRKAQVG